MLKPYSQKLAELNAKAVERNRKGQERSAQLQELVRAGDLTAAQALQIKMGRRPLRQYYKVGVNKTYFPRGLWPKEITFYQEYFKVLAMTEREACNKVWAMHGQRLLGLMTPDRKIVRLQVNRPPYQKLVSRGQSYIVYCTHKPAWNDATRCQYCKETLNA